jgi:putative endonuclease|tara:strand:+ start:357 stop:635 length:279 start_codon:yes stop_codon:yes gene_type:complete
MYFVYLIISKKRENLISYVGYTNNLEKRLLLHNTGKGAKFTKGRKWDLIYFKEYKNKNTALKEEYRLKKNYNLRKEIKNNYTKNENISTFTI